MKSCNGKRLYLACPYSSMVGNETWWEDLRYNMVNMAAAYLMLEGYIVFSPISHTHPIARAAGEYLPRTWAFWSEQDYSWLDVCDELCILDIVGSGESVGLRDELVYAQKRQKKVWFLSWREVYRGLKKNWVKKNYEDKKNYEESHDAAPSNGI